ncbi:MAG: hypothetical protein AAGC64_11530 [Bacteroidota bacterium]
MQVKSLRNSRSYKKQANAVDNTKTVRAVARANGEIEFLSFSLATALLAQTAAL